MTVSFNCIYAPDMNQPIHEREKFFKSVQVILDEIHNKESINENGNMLIEFSTHYEFHINNSFEYKSKLL